MSYVGRLAPSPTGLLHLGHALTFQTAWQRADAAGGVLRLRIEDLDRERSREIYVDALLEDLAWLGIGWQGEVVRQSQRHAAYRAVLEQLLRDGHAYPCTCSRRDLAQAAAAPHEDQAAPGREQAVRPLADQPPADDEPLYPGHCRQRTGQGFRDGVSYRLRVPDGDRIRFDDREAGPQDYLAGTDFGDFLLWRRDGVPSYQLACVVDDAAMDITEVVRGADLMKSTARQIVLARALGVPSPCWCHVPLVRDSDGVRLAKRRNDLSIRLLRRQGLAPAQVLEMAHSAQARPDDRTPRAITA